MPDFDAVRRIAMALPEAEEILTWETDVTFRVRSKIFAIGGDGADHVSIKAPPLLRAALADDDPKTFAPAAYVGRFGWVTVDLGRIDGAELERLIRQAWRLTAPKRTAATRDAGPRCAAPR